RQFTPDRRCWQSLSHLRHKLKRRRTSILLLAIGVLTILLLFKQYGLSWLIFPPSIRTRAPQTISPSLSQQPQALPNSRESVSAPQRTKPRTQASTKPKQSLTPSTTTRATKMEPPSTDLSTDPLANQGETFHPLAEDSPSITR